MTAGVKLTGLVKTYGEATAVQGVDLDVPAGDFLCLLGPSGCGKSTILRMIAGLEAQTAGRIEIRGETVADPAAGLFATPERRDVGLVFQNYALWPHLTVARNVEFGLRLRRMSAAARAQRVSEVLEEMEIAALAERYPGQLSGGQQQRVAIARTLAVEPKVLLMDEPLSNLDARLRLEMRGVLKRLHARLGATIIFVTHDQWEAMTLASTIAVMRDGRIEQVGTPEAIYERPESRFVVEFVGAPPINIFDLAAATPIARALAAAAGPRVVSAGVRPEALVLGQPAADVAFAAPAEVTGVLPTGGAWIVELACGNDTVFALSHNRPAVAPGDHIRVSAPRHAPHLFDDAGRTCSPVSMSEPATLPTPIDRAR